MLEIEKKTERNKLIIKKQKKKIVKKRK